ncbi:CoA-binding protein [candidate division KSB1 bacterium]|nr:CoA-binding protein [candidate division KSB1 bacterium]
MDPSEKTVIVLGASKNPERYANKAIRLLVDNGYPVIPVNPREQEIEGLPVVHVLAEIDQPIHTITLYIGPQRSERMGEDIILLKPQRVIFNPGTESEALKSQLESAGIQCVEGCTLVMLHTKQF